MHKGEKFMVLLDEYLEIREKMQADRATIGYTDPNYYDRLKELRFDIATIVNTIT